MYHSITFGTKNTWADWHLIPTSRPLVNPPSVKTNFVSIPGGDGTLDLTESLSGRPTFEDRTGSWTFVVDNDYTFNVKPWSELYSEIMSYLHGKRMEMFLEDDPDWKYRGRFSVNSWKSDPYRSSIVIDYVVGPYKVKDVTESATFTTSKSMVIEIVGSESIPTINASNSNIYVLFNGQRFDLASGDNTFEGLVLQNGSNTLSFRGSGMVTVTYKKGGL